MTDIAEKSAELLAALPLGHALGFEAVEFSQGRAVIAMPYDARFIGDPSSGVIHGGAISVLMDTAGGASVLSAGPDIASTATLDLRIDYMRPATPGQTIRATAICAHLTRHVAFVRITATDDDAARPVAQGTGTFTVERTAQEAGA